MLELTNVPIGRLAPSPTGAQHIGNARTYLLAWLSIRSRGGRIILRMEDIDSPRVKFGAERQAIEDLRWLGLDWDEGPDVGGTSAPYVQTHRMEMYRAYLKQLQHAEQIYPCTCSRSDVQAAASAPHAGQEGPIYPGVCAGRTAMDAATIGDAPFSWRFRTSAKKRQFRDGVTGFVECSVSKELGDFVVAKMNGAPAYQLAVVIDDHFMGVNEVLRGDDLLPSAFRQLDLYDVFGWPAPTFIHAPLVVGPDGRRLAKRHGDTRLATLREAGVAPEKLLGLLAWSCGFRDAKEPATAEDLLSDFDLAKIPHEPFVFQDAMWRALL